LKEYIKNPTKADKNTVEMNNDKMEDLINNGSNNNIQAKYGKSIIKNYKKYEP
jgi:hypothetical protein